MIYVLDEVMKSGHYPLKVKTTVLQAVTLATEMEETAARNKIVMVLMEKDDIPIVIEASYDGQRT